jgi:hypothetical protein
MFKAWNRIGGPNSLDGNCTATATAIITAFKQAGR